MKTIQTKKGIYRCSRLSKYKLKKYTKCIKEENTMKKAEVINILERIRSLLYNNAQFEAKEYTSLEINNLKGIIPEECRDTLYHYYFCDKCRIINCPKNENKDRLKG